MTRRRTQPRPGRKRTVAKRTPAKQRTAAKRTVAKPERLTPKSSALPILERVRAFCMALPDVTEKASHGAPTWFYKKKVLGYFLDNHHGDGRLALWLPAPDGAQAMLVDSNPDVYFVPPYVGYRGWIGVRLDRDAEWNEISAVIEAGYQTLQSKQR